MTRIKVVLFDLDGTLADTLPDIAAGVNYALKKFDYPELSVESVRSIVGCGLTKLIEQTLPNAVTSEQINLIRDAWLEYSSDHCLDFTRPYPGVEAALAELKRRGIQLGVVTNKPQDIADKVISGLFGDTFGCVYGMEADTPRKPDPYTALKALAQFGADSSEAIFVGDSGIDMQTAVNAGCLPVGVTWGYRDVNELTQAGAVYLIREPSELLGLCR